MPCTICDPHKIQTSRWKLPFRRQLWTLSWSARDCYVQKSIRIRRTNSRSRFRHGSTRWIRRIFGKCHMPLRSFLSSNIPPQWRFGIYRYRKPYIRGPAVVSRPETSSGSFLLNFVPTSRINQTLNFYYELQLLLPCYRVLPVPIPSYFTAHSVIKP